MTLKRTIRKTISSIISRPFTAIPSSALTQADVISLDVFDTLIFRTVAEPEDVFDMISDEPGFKAKRIEAKYKARTKCGYDLGGVKVYVSTEYGKTKKSGNLFREVMREQGTENILHIGDHIISDYVRPRQVGMKGVLYKTGVIQIKERT